MKKFNQAEAFWIQKGLELVEKEAKAEIDRTITSGKIPFMTTGYISQQIEELRKKVGEMTKKG